MVSHTNDSTGVVDSRLIRVPPRKFSSGSKRPIMPDVDKYPRLVSSHFGPGFQESKIEKDLSYFDHTPPIYYIDEVASTYGYYDDYYPIMNDEGLAFAESTCSAKIFADQCKFIGQREIKKNCALLSINELTRIALERTRTAQTAIELMGALAEKYGFYGAKGDESGESLMVADLSETWIFHILASDPLGTSAVWAAQRVPSDHVAVVANMFVIRDIDFNSQDYKYSSNIKTVAEKFNIWKEGLDFDFSFIYTTGEYNHKYNTGRRMWRVYSLLGLQFPSEYTGHIHENKIYPVSSRYNFKISSALIRSIYRDHYEGTIYDMRKGKAAGPFSNPVRYENPDYFPIEGWFERAINVARVDHSYVSIINDKLPYFWFAHSDPCVSPYYVIPMKSEKLNDRFYKFNSLNYERYSTWWLSRLTANVVQARYDLLQTYALNYSITIEDAGLKLIQLIMQRGYRNDYFLDSIFDKYHEISIQQYSLLMDNLLFSVADGYDNSQESIGNLIGYHAKWLKEVGYEKTSYLAKLCNRDGITVFCNNTLNDKANFEGQKGYIKGIKQRKPFKHVDYKAKVDEKKINNYNESVDNLLKQVQVGLVFD